MPLRLVEAWCARASSLVDSHGIDIRRVAGDYVLTYRVVTGDTIRTLWRELYEFYTAPTTREWIRFMTGESEIYTSRNQRSCININHMSRSGESYRWHLDATPYTLLLFLSTSAAEDGGALELSPPRQDVLSRQMHETDDVVQILPRAGTLVLMDGTRCRHRVAPLLRTAQRITVPMVYPNIRDDSRPSGLDDYLYLQD